MNDFFKHNMARNNLNVVKISARQDEISIEEEVIMTVSDFNIPYKKINRTSEHKMGQLQHKYLLSFYPKLFIVLEFSLT